MEGNFGSATSHRKQLWEETIFVPGGLKWFHRGQLYLICISRKKTKQNKINVIQELLPVELSSSVDFDSRPRVVQSEQAFHRNNSVEQKIVTANLVNTAVFR